MKKLLALLLVLAMVFTLCACGKNEDSTKTGDNNQGTSAQGDNNIPDDTGAKDDDKADVNKGDEEKEETIVGTWTSKVDLWEATKNMMASAEEELDDALAEVMERLYKGVSFKLTLTFNENGKLTMTEALSDVMDDVVDNIEKNPDILINYLTALLEAEGMTPADFEATEGMTIEAYVEELCDTNQIGSFFGELEDIVATMEYTLSGNKLRVIDGEAEEVFTIDLDGDEMTFVDYTSNTEGEDIIAAIFEGMTFKRK